MAYEFTFTTGSRDSRSRRGGGGRIDVGASNVRSRDFAREVPDIRPDLSGTAAIQGITGALGSFFGKASEAERKAEMDDEKERNALAVADAKAKIAQDRKGAREALRTGDYSKFIPDDELRQRKVVQQAFASMVAADAALDDYETTYKEAVRSTPVDGDPRAAVEAALRENLKGAHPIYAETYTNAILKHTSADIEAWQKARLSGMVLKAEATGMAVANKAIKRGDVRTIDNFNALATQIASSLPIPGPAAFRAAQAMVENAAIEAVQKEGSEAAFRVLEFKDPERNGMSILDIRKIDKSALMQAYRDRLVKTQSEGAVKDLDGLDDRLQLLENGQSTDDGAVDLLNALVALQDKHGARIKQSQRYAGLRKRVLAQIKSVGDFGKVVEMMKANRMPSDVNGAQKVLAENIANGKLMEALIKDGNSPARAAGMMNNWIAQVGMNAQGKKMFATNLTGGSPEHQERTFAMLSSLDTAGGNVRQLLPEGDEGHIAFALYSRLQSNPLAATQTLAQWNEMNKLAPPFKGDPSTYFNSVEDGKGGTRGQKYVRKLVQEVIADQAGGFFDSGRSDVTPALRATLELHANYAGYVFRGLPYDESRLKADLMQTWNGLFVERVSNSDGDSIWDVRRGAPKIGVDPHGKPTAVHQGNLEEQKVLTLAVHPTVSEVVPGAYVTADSGTAEGRGYAVLDMLDRPIMVLPGERKYVDKEMASSEYLQMFFDFLPTSDPDQMIMVAPGMPREGETRVNPLDKNFAFTWNDEIQAFELRAAVTPKDSTTVAREESIRQTQTEAAAAKQAEVEARRAGAPLFGTTGALHNKGRERVPGLLERVERWFSPNPKGTSVEPTDADQASVDAFVSEVLNSLHANGTTDPETALKTKLEVPRPKVNPRLPEGPVDDSPEIEAFAEEARKAVRAENAQLLQWTEDATIPMEEKASQRLFHHMEEFEGFVPFVYDDASPLAKKKAWGDSAKKGRPTVGLGFNLERADARKLLAEVGADYDALLAGRTALSREQARKLFDITLQKFRREMIDTLPEGVAEDLLDHQVMALLSLVYNAGTQTMMGPGTRMWQALKDRDWLRAEDEIRVGSINRKGMKARGEGHLIDGLQRRRHAEANMFRGVTDIGE